MPKPKAIISPGHRLLSALLSYQQGHVGVDRLLKHYAHVQIHPSWDILAIRILREINEQVDAAFNRQPPKWLM